MRPLNGARRRHPVGPVADGRSPGWAARWAGFRARLAVRAARRRWYWPATITRAICGLVAAATWFTGGPWVNHVFMDVLAAVLIGWTVISRAQHRIIEDQLDTMQAQRRKMRAMQSRRDRAWMN